MGGAVDENLVFDLGLHQGEDSEFYLEKGFRVVAVEAMKSHCDDVADRLRSYVESGRLTILNVAVAERSGPVSFYVNPHSDWGTIRESWAEEKARLGSPSSGMVTVDGMTMLELLQQHGTPYFLKVDLEGADMLCLDGLAQWGSRPPLVSIESDTESWRGLLAEFRALKALGYTRFKAVAQDGVDQQRCPQPAREGRYVDHTFPQGSSGLFGDEAPGEWVSERRIIARYALIFLRYRLYGDHGILRRHEDHRFLGRGVRIVRSVLVRLLGQAGWYDTHASVGRE